MMISVESKQSSIFQSLHHLAQRLVGVLECIFEIGARGPQFIHIATCNHLLPHADFLKIHAEDGRNANVKLSGVILALNLIRVRLLWNDGQLYLKSTV